MEQTLYSMNINLTGSMLFCLAAPLHASSTVIPSINNYAVLLTLCHDISSIENVNRTGVNLYGQFKLTD